MAKVKPLTKTQEIRKRLSENLKLIQGHHSGAEMGQIMGISSATYSRKSKNPESFKLSEIRLMCDYFSVNMSDFLNGSLKIGA